MKDMKYQTYPFLFHFLAQFPIIMEKNIHSMIVITISTSNYYSGHFGN